MVHVNGGLAVVSWETGCRVETQHQRGQYCFKEIAKQASAPYKSNDMATLQKKKDEEKALKELRAKAQQKGSFGGTGLKKSGKK